MTSPPTAATGAAWRGPLWSAALAAALLAGCHRAPAPPRVVTFNKDVAPILFEHCATCHRPVDGSAALTRPTNDADPICVAGAPFSVLDYASVQRRAQAIASAVRRRSMPPWLPEPGHGDFAHERRLRDDQIALIEQWAKQSAPEGDATDRPRVPTFAGNWQLGTPDLVLPLPDAYTLQPSARDVFRNFVVPVSLMSTRYVRGVEFLADNAQVLHHANLALDPDRVSRGLDRADPGPGFASMADDEVQNVFGWSPGKVPVMESADTAWALEPGADLVVQLHMVAAKTPQTVRPTIGLFFSDAPPTRAPIVVKLESKSIDIPAGEVNYAIEDHYLLPADVDAVSVYPHAHYLAKEMRGTATLPDGSTRDLIWIRQWDVRWQDQYRYREPLFLPKGTTLTMRFTYDNSATNPNNRQRPPQRVQWGPLSADEMGALWLEVVPRRIEDGAVLARDYAQRALQQDVASAEMRLRSTPGDPALHNALALKYLQAGRVADAQSQLEEALRLDPRDAEAHSNLGTVLQGLGRLQEGLTHLREAARVKPKDDRVHVNLGNGFTAIGDRTQAMRELRAAVALNDDNADAHFNLAMLLGPQGQVDEAIAHLRRVVEIAPRNGEANRNLAVAYGLKGRLDEAIEQARIAVRLEPDSAAARDQLNRLLAARSR